MLNIDQLDKELMSLLARNARMGVVDISAALGIARNTVQSRLRRLEDSGLLRGFRPNLDLSVVGITAEAFIWLELEQGRMKAVVASLKSIPEILEVHATTGRADLLVRVVAAGHSALHDLIEEVVAVPGVSHTTTTLSLASPLTYRIQPLLDKLTKNSGWGRSTPDPRFA
ncbi:AsnC family transcriptional regulator [Prescottella equi]|uniref:Lrp/AsnC family transcriptional regulator n=1 Tax=Rhodococcus hoagii TaxID=43767 RepID=UPI000A121921|nr:Lrp/AsnC family transcriptional regulator [Prescottella equi]ORJ92534.1 AsnC family transcriptional regulator [Prescottella equi]